MFDALEPVLYVGGSDGIVYQLDLATGRVQASRTVDGDNAAGITDLALTPASATQPASLLATSSEGHLVRFCVPFCSGSACVSGSTDTDRDGISDTVDNCRDIPNPDQNDADADGIGDPCDADVNGDGVANRKDACPGSTPAEGVNRAGCTVVQLNPCAGPRGGTSPWRNHGVYVSSVVRTATQFLNQGLLSDEQFAGHVCVAASSSCGR